MSKLSQQEVTTPEQQLTPTPENTQCAGEPGVAPEPQSEVETKVPQDAEPTGEVAEQVEKGEVLEEILEEERQAEANLKEKRDKFGLDHPETLEACLRMLDSWIGLYKLRPMDELLNEVIPIAKAKYPDLYPRFIQSQAFLRFKQFRFKESLSLFKEFRELVGPSPELLENMGHTHNTLGEYEEALQCFDDAIQIVHIRAATIPGYVASNHLGGLYLGKATTFKRLGRYEEALKDAMAALDAFRKRFGGQDHSLIAKALTGAADIQYRLGRNDLALPLHEEAVRLFYSTCGNSPLTANAFYGLGRCHEALNNIDKALECYDDALKLHVGFDTLDMTRIVKILGRLFNLRTTQARTVPPEKTLKTLTELFAPYLPTLKKGHASLIEQKREKTDDAAVYYKFCGEFLILAGLNAEAAAYFTLAINILKTIKDFDCRDLIASCETMLQMAKARIRT